jgi:aspartate/methionine/tyrosine aminotransferase/methylase of polypeptide subunit release factors
VVVDAMTMLRPLPHLDQHEHRLGRADALASIFEPNGPPTPALVEARVEQCLRHGLSTATRQPLLEALLQALESRSRRELALAILHRLRVAGSANAPVRVIRTPLRTSQLRRSIDLLLVPGIFEPESWSHTFLEGLLRRPPHSYEGKQLIELGAGSGWVSIALLETTRLHSVLCLDVNPIAVLVCRINAILNSHDDALQPRRTLDGRLLHQRLEAQTSDLLEFACTQQRRADLIIGCIPQVPAPPEQPIAAHDELAMSNYAVPRGVGEDRIGLGLLARALEQSPQVLAPGGRVLLNVAGRPGWAAIEPMFNRRGYRVREVWRRRIAQAGDTDISPLVALERDAPAPFQFFVDKHGEQPISARTAQALRELGHPIWHDLMVLEAWLPDQPNLRRLYKAMAHLGLAGCLDRLDLSAADARQLGFLRALAESLVAGKRAPYTHECGSAKLRRGIASHLQGSFDLRFSEHDVFVAPSREQLLLGLLLSLCEPGDVVLASSMAAPTSARCCELAGVKLIAGNDRIAELGQLARMLAPRLVVVGVGPDSRPDAAALAELCREAAGRGDLVIVEGELDQSAWFEALASMNDATLEHVVTVIALRDDAFDAALQPAFALGGPARLQQALVAFAESTYSRINCFGERYFEAVFEELVAFQLQRSSTHLRLAVASERRGAPLSSRIEALLQVEALAGEPSSPEPDCIRLDYGENELEMPERLAQGVMLGFAEPHADVDEHRLAELVAALLHHRGDHSTIASDQIVLGPGVFPLLFAAASALQARLGGRPRVAVAEGYYGLMPALLTLAGCEVVVVPARAHSFLLVREQLERLAEPPQLLLVNNPANPAGIAYPRATLEGLCEYASTHGCWLLCDEVFAGLELSDAREPQASLAKIVERYPARQRSLVFSGFSKSFAAGGLRVGWMVTSDRALATSVRRHVPGGIERHARVACEVFLRGLLGSSSERIATGQTLVEYRQRMVEVLARQRERLLGLLRQHGLRVPEGPAAGLFVFPDVSSLYGRELRAGSQTLQLSEQTLPGVLREHYGLSVNTGAWAGTSGHLRLCFSLEPQRFDRAMARLERFFADIRVAG